MGCSIISTQKNQENKENFKWKPDKSCKTPTESSNDDTVDRKNCPLSKRQRFQIVKSWKGISRNIKDTGVNMFVRLLGSLLETVIKHKSKKAINQTMIASIFIGSCHINNAFRMFETNADVAALFIGFGNLADISSLRQNKRLENHATMVMHVLDEAISSMDDTEYVIEMLQGIGKSHRKISGFDPNFFLKIEEPFLLAVQETLQDRYSANISHVYKITIRFILMELNDGYRNGPDDDRYSENG